MAEVLRVPEARFAGDCFYTHAQRKPIVVQDQGSFVVGGTVITNPGTFDPIRRTPEARLWRDAVNRHGGNLF